jgi:hypothetical protein
MFWDEVHQVGPNEGSQNFRFSNSFHFDNWVNFYFEIIYFDGKFGENQGQIIGNTIIFFPKLISCRRHIIYYGKLSSSEVDYQPLWLIIISSIWFSSRMDVIELKQKIPSFYGWLSAVLDDILKQQMIFIW